MSLGASGAPEILTKNERIAVRTKRLAALAGPVVGLAMMVGTAAAGTITNPASNPFAVPGTYQAPVPFDISGSGYPAGGSVSVEICDGVLPTTPGYDPAAHCDIGTSPAPATPDASGNVTFLASDINARIGVFDGPSPQFLFNCLAVGEPDPNNALPSFTNCQIRLSTNNTAVTSDQAYKTMSLPGPGTGVPGVPTTTVIPVALVAGGAGFFLLRRRRPRQSAAA
jgi:hypothetical protein